jgi:hypothetical protein
MPVHEIEREVSVAMDAVVTGSPQSVARRPPLNENDLKQVGIGVGCGNAHRPGSGTCGGRCRGPRCSRSQLDELASWLRAREENGCARRSRAGVELES